MVEILLFWRNNGIFGDVSGCHGNQLMKTTGFICSCDGWLQKLSFDTVIAFLSIIAAEIWSTNLPGYYTVTPCLIVTKVIQPSKRPLRRQTCRVPESCCSISTLPRFMNEVSN